MSKQILEISIVKKVIFLFLFAISFSAFAGVFELGKAAYDRKNYATAVAKFKIASEQGNERAQFWLGFMYDEGLGVKQNYAEAMRFYLLAAEQGYQVAQMNIAYMYEKGRGVEQNDDEALRWSGMAATQGLTVPPSSIAVMTHPNEELESIENTEKKEPNQNVLENYKSLATQGDIPAKRKLAIMYRDGDQVEENLVEAGRLFQEAAEQGDVYSQIVLAKMYVMGEGFTPNETVAFRWFEMAAAQGSPEARDLMELILTKYAPLPYYK